MSIAAAYLTMKEYNNGINALESYTALNGKKTYATMPFSQSYMRVLAMQTPHLNTTNYTFLRVIQTMWLK